MDIVFLHLVGIDSSEYIVQVLFSAIETLNMVTLYQDTPHPKTATPNLVAASSRFRAPQSTYLRRPTPGSKHESSYPNIETTEFEPSELGNLQDGGY